MFLYYFWMGILCPFYYIESISFLSSGCWWLENGVHLLPVSLFTLRASKWFLPHYFWLMVRKNLQFLQVIYSDYLPDPIQVMPRVLAKIKIFLVSIEGLVTQPLHPLGYYNSTSLPRSA